MRRFAALAGCAAAVLAAVAAPQSRAATAQQTIALLNAQRAANGLPADIVEDPALTSDCAAHDRYMFLNHRLTHVEQQGAPGFSSGGEYAGENAVLSHGPGWDAGNPYESAPLHLDQLLAPRLRSVGSADLDGYSCTTTFPGWNGPDPAGPVVYTYPGNGAGIYPSEVASELPWTPGQLVGIPPQTTTGPYLIVFVDAPGQNPIDNPATLADATLVGPSGPIAITTVDGSKGVPGGGTLGAYLSPGGFMIPAMPLIAGATYHAQVVVTFAGVQTAHDWSFTVRGNDPQSSLSVRRDTLSFASSSPQPVRVRFTRSGGRHAPSVTIRPGASVHLKLSPGSWEACGRQLATRTYTGYSGCIAIIVTGIPKLRLAPGRLQGQQVLFALSYSPVLRGRSATLTVTPVTVTCSGHGCTTAAGASSTRTIVVAGTTLSLPLPPPGHGIRVQLATRAFQLRDAPWTAARAHVLFIRGPG